MIVDRFWQRIRQHLLSDPDKELRDLLTWKGSLCLPLAEVWHTACGTRPGAVGDVGDQCVGDLRQRRLRHPASSEAAVVAAGYLLGNIGPGHERPSPVQAMGGRPYRGRPLGCVLVVVRPVVFRR